MIAGFLFQEFAEQQDAHVEIRKCIAEHNRLSERGIREG